MLKTAVFFFAILALAWSQTTPVNTCLFHNAPQPINTHIEDCAAPPCQLPQLRDIVLHIIFQAPYTMRTMTTVATAYILGPIGISYDLGEQAVTCNFLTNTFCPVLQDEVVTYTLRMYIESFFPVGTQVTIEFRINDDNGTPIMCIRLPIAIIAALPSVGAAGEAIAHRANTTAPIIVKLNAGQM